jgi:hypothetical protein
MTTTLVDVLSTKLRPLCSRDNHVMQYESIHSRSNSGDEASYHCGFQGCSVRYNPSEGYYMLIGMPDHANSVDEPGVNILKCPRHDQWLHRRVIDAEPGVCWCCGVEGCDHRMRA